jgi:hypothetical protein
LGGSAGSGPGAGGGIGMGGSSCLGLAYNDELVDDMDDGSPSIPSVAGRSGLWSDSDDGAPGGIMFPDPAGPFTMTDTGDVCRKLAVYVHGSGFSLWGANVGVGLGNPYDASKYIGIAFWAKADAGTSAEVRVAFPDNDTSLAGGLCTSNPTGPTACGDHFGVRVTLYPHWSKYAVSFAEIRQDGWGRQTEKFDPATLYGILFQIPVDATFGLWIDDIMLAHQL